MKYMLSIGAICFSAMAAQADPSGSVLIPQLKPNSVLVEKKDEALTPAEAVPSRTIGDDLKTILQDHKMSELGRANAVISSQYGAEPLVSEKPAETKTPPAKKSKDSKKQPVLPVN